jgi:hypothetical protein
MMNISYDFNSISTGVGGGSSTVNNIIPKPASTTIDVLSYPKESTGRSSDLRDNIDNGYTFDVRYSLEHSIIKQGESQMSYAVTVKHNNFALISTDTRSTILHETGTGEPTPEFYDDYKKLAQVPGSNIVVAGTGANDFMGDTLAGVISTIKSSNFDDVCHELAELSSLTVFNTSKKIFLHVSAYDGEKFKYCCLTVSHENVNYHRPVWFAGKKRCQWLSSAPDWLIEKNKGFAFSPRDSADDAIADLYEHMYEVFKNSASRDKAYDSSVGGGIDMVLLEPYKAPVFLDRVFPEA